MIANNEPSQPQLFDIDLAANGGRFSPSSAQDVMDWLMKEQGLWSWLRNGSFGNHVMSVNNALHSISEGINAAQRALQYPEQSSQVREVAAMHAAIEQAFNQHRLPHSSTAIANAVEAYRQSHGDLAASFYLAAHLPPPPNYQIEPKYFEQWRGWIEGLSRHFPADETLRRQLLAHDKSLQDLHSRFSSSLAEKDIEVEGLRRSFSSSEASFRELLTKAGEQLSADREQQAKELSDAIRAHKETMEGIKSAFRESMKLRAPVDYWSTKAENHRSRAVYFSVRVTALLFVSFLGLPFAFWFVLGNVPVGSAPSPWQLGALLSLSLFLVWPTRILIRNYLSHVHLQADAQERVVMVKTYLSLTEDGKIESDEDRQIILHALFRPASDGLIKDEGVPLSLAELITRQKP